MMRAHLITSVLYLVLALQSRGGTPAVSEPAAETEVKPWEYSISALYYFEPHEKDYVVPTVTADHDWLHLEGRYQYEDLKTGSLWVGYNFSTGKTLEFAATPMIGGLFGNTRGMAPGLKLAFTYGRFELTTESEYVFDFRDSSGNFFYNWSELTWSPYEWMHIGFVGERTRVYKSDLDIQRGFLIGFSWKKVNLTAYVLNVDKSSPITILAIGFHF
jgi:hypothetical protein